MPEPLIVVVHGLWHGGWSWDLVRDRPDLGVAATRLGEILRFEADGAEVRLDPDGARELLYHDIRPVLAEWALARLRPVARGLFSARPAEFAWRDRPSTYVVCAADRVVAPELQRAMAQRASVADEWDCGHSLILSRPDRVAELLLGTHG